jgi:hypothetical protein
LLFPAIGLAIDQREAWRRIEWADGREPPEYKDRARPGEAVR